MIVLNLIFYNYIFRAKFFILIDTDQTDNKTILPKRLFFSYFLMNLN